MINIICIMGNVVIGYPDLSAGYHKNREKELRRGEDAQNPPADVTDFVGRESQ